MKFDLFYELENIKNDFKNKNYKKQLANILTASRLLSPFILIPLIYYNKLTIFLIMIIIFSLTDAFDGYFARKYNSVSLFGRYLDAVVDKIFALSLLIPVIIRSNLDFINFYLVIFVIVLESIIGAINFYSFCKSLNPKSTMFGKIKTYFLFILLVLLYLDKINNVNNSFLFVFIIITAIFQLISIISYIYQIKKRKTNSRFS